MEMFTPRNTNFLFSTSLLSTLSMVGRYLSSPKKNWIFSEKKRDSPKTGQLFVKKYHEANFGINRPWNSIGITCPVIHVQKVSFLCDHPVQCVALWWLNWKSYNCNSYTSRSCGPPTVFTTLSSSPRLRLLAVVSLSSLAVSLLILNRLWVGETGRGRWVSTASIGSRI